MFFRSRDRFFVWPELSLFWTNCLVSNAYARSSEAMIVTSVDDALILCRRRELIEKRRVMNQGTVLAKIRARTYAATQPQIRAPTGASIRASMSVSSSIVDSCAWSDVDWSVDSNINSDWTSGVFSLISRAWFPSTFVDSLIRYQSQRNSRGRITFRFSAVPVSIQ